jgi:polar amino acid transport system substrate-binding protein
MQVDFSFPYSRTGIKLLVQRGSGIRGFADIGSGERLIVGRDTTGEAVAKRLAPDAELIFVESSGEAALRMRSGEAQAYAQDGALVDFLARIYPDQLEALPEVYSSDAITFGVRKGNPELLRWLDLFASTFVSSGKYAEVYTRWWGAPPPVLTPIW